MGIFQIFCRKCDKVTEHVVQYKLEDNPEKDFAKVKCIHCTEEPFVVECEKGKNPTDQSRRIGEVFEIHTEQSH